MAIKPKPKSKSNPYDSKILRPAGKQQPGDFEPKSWDKKYKPVPGGGAGDGYLNLGPREKDPNGMSRNGSKIKKAKNGFDLNKDGKTTQKDVLIGRGVLPKTAKKGAKVAKMAKCKYGCK
jgi:hypothetical protein